MHFIPATERTANGPATIAEQLQFLETPRALHATNLEIVYGCYVARSIRDTYVFTELRVWTHTLSARY